MEWKTAIHPLILILLIFNVKSILAEENLHSWCPEGWREFQNRCYNIYTNEIGGVADRTFEEAQKFCEENGGTLATIKSIEEQNFLNAYLASLSPDRPLWIGLKKPEPWMVNTDPLWIDGTSEFNFQNYLFGQPDGGFDQRCFIMNHEEIALGKWKDEVCTDKNGFVCQREKEIKGLDDIWCPNGFTRYRDSCYRLESAKADFWSAEKECKTKYDSGLVSVKDSHEEQFVNKLVTNLQEKVWTGFSNHNNEQGGFHWTDAKNEPHFQPLDGSVISLTEKCVAAAPGGIGWSVEDCSRKNSFVCAKRITKIEKELKIEVRECPEGWLDIKDDYCYYVESKEHKSVQESKIACAEKSPKAELALLESPDAIVHLGPSLMKYENTTFMMEMKESFQSERKNEVMEKCVEIDSVTLELKHGCPVARNYICQTVKGIRNTTSNERSKGVGSDGLNVPKIKETTGNPDIPRNLRLNEESTTSSNPITTDQSKTDLKREQPQNEEKEDNAGLSNEAVALISVGLVIIALELVAIGCIIYRRRCFYEHGHE